MATSSRSRRGPRLRGITSPDRGLPTRASSGVPRRGSGSFVPIVPFGEADGLKRVAVPFDDAPMRLPTTLGPARLPATPERPPPRVEFLAGVLVLALSLVACHDRTQGPTLASSAEQPGYALRYPEEVARLNDQLQAQTDAATQVGTELAKFPDALSEPDWNEVANVYTHAHEEGKGLAYAQRFEESVVVQRFFDDEKQTIVGRVAWGAQHAAKERGHDIQLHGPISFALERAVEKQLSERMRADSTAHALLAERGDALGKKNVETLQQQADQLAFVSHVVHVRWLDDQRRLSELVDEQSRVRSTLQSRIEELEKADKPDPKQLEQYKAALAKLNDSIARTEQTVEDSERRGEQLRSDYETAFRRLMDEVEKRADLSSTPAQ